MCATATDPRITPANGRVALAGLHRDLPGEREVTGQPARILRPVVDLLRSPDGPRDRQLLFGEGVTLLEDRAGWAFVQAARDGYVGYVPRDTLGAAQAATHHVAVPATHLYEAEDFRARDRAALSFGSRITVTDERRRFWETPDGFIPKPHLWPLSKRFTDPVTVAQLHFGVPYLWGGNSVRGIDCSGLVQAAMLACGYACPGDSDMQSGLGTAVAQDQPARGDLWFWKGHVAMLVDPETLIHANAHHMAVAYEPARHAILRIEAQGDGPVTARRRV